MAQLGVNPPPGAPPPAHSSCSTRAYLEPSLLMTINSGEPTAFTRVAAGALIRSCGSPVQVRVGATGYVGHVGQIGAGLESELDNSVGTSTRVGLHAAYETAQGGPLYSVDLRLHYLDQFWIQGGAYHWTSDSGPQTGAMVGFGFEGTPGAILGGVELGVGGVLFLMILAALSNERT